MIDEPSRPPPPTISRHARRPGWSRANRRLGLGYQQRVECRTGSCRVCQRVQHQCPEHCQACLLLDHCYNHYTYNICHGTTGYHNGLHRAACAIYHRTQLEHDQLYESYLCRSSNYHHRPNREWGCSGNLPGGLGWA